VPTFDLRVLNVRVDGRGGDEPYYPPTSKEVTYSFSVVVELGGGVFVYGPGWIRSDAFLLELLAHAFTPRDADTSNNHARKATRIVRSP
jgi:hypothetical protein